MRPPLVDASSQVRLLSISRDRNLLAYSDDLHCTLASYALIDVSGRYTAVSYTWGPKTPTKTIFV